MNAMNAFATRRRTVGARAGALSALLLAAWPALAADPTPAPSAADVAAFEQRFKATNPGTRVDAVTASPIPGLFEVQMGKNLAYVDASGRYALFGHLYDMRDRRDITADRLAVIERIDPTALPRELALKHVKGKGTRTLYVFADPQCGFCKQFEQSLQALEDVTVYTFVVPLLGAESRRLADAVSCDANPTAAWSDWMLRGRAPTANAAVGAACAARSDAITKLAQDLGVSGTPTLVAGDGRKAAGAMSTAAVHQWLDGGSTRTAATSSAAR